MCTDLETPPKDSAKRKMVHNRAHALHSTLNFDYKTPAKQTEPAHLYFSHCCYANGEAEVCRDGRMQHRSPCVSQAHGHCHSATSRSLPGDTCVCWVNMERFTDLRVILAQGPS